MTGSGRATCTTGLFASFISYTSAAPGHGFTTAVVIGRDDITGAGVYVAAPGVRLVGSGSDSSVLGYTIYAGGHFRVQVADAVAGHVQAAQTVSPPDVDAVFGDLAYARAGGTLALWRPGTRGSDSNGPQRVYATVRPAGAVSFGAPEAVSDPIDPTTPNATTVPYSPFGAVDPVTGAAIATFGYLTQNVSLSARAPLR